MKMCDSCKFNLDNELSGFNFGIMKMLKRSCDNYTLFNRNCMEGSCLEMFALQIISKKYDEFINRCSNGQFKNIDSEDAVL